MPHSRFIKMAKILKSKKLKTPFGRYKSAKFIINKATEPKPSVMNGSTITTWTDGVLQHMMDHGISLKNLERFKSFLDDQGYDTEAVMEDGEGFNIETFQRSSNTRFNVIDSLNGDKRRYDLLHQYGKLTTRRESTFSTGFVFYYWPYYKNKKRLRFDRDDSNHSP